MNPDPLVSDAVLYWGCLGVGLLIAVYALVSYALELRHRLEARRLDSLYDFDGHRRRDAIDGRSSWR